MLRDTAYNIKCTHTSTYQVLLYLPRASIFLHPKHIEVILRIVILLYNKYMMSCSFSLPASSCFTNRSNQTQHATLTSNYLPTNQHTYTHKLTLSLSSCWFHIPLCAIFFSDFFLMFDQYTQPGRIRWRVLVNIAMSSELCIAYKYVNL